MPLFLDSGFGVGIGRQQLKFLTKICLKLLFSTEKLWFTTWFLRSMGSIDISSEDSTEKLL